MIPITPLHHVESIPGEAGHWNATGIDPYFSVPLPPASTKGWQQIRLIGSSETPRSLKLYIDTGAGYSERETLVFGCINGSPRTLVQYLHLPTTVRALRLDAGEISGRFTIRLISFRPISPAWVNVHVLGKAIYRGWRIRSSILPKARGLLRHGLRKGWSDLRQQALYSNATIERERQAYHPETHTQILARAEAMLSEMDTWTGPPIISLLVPVFNPDPGHLQACIDSVRSQIYPHWQLCLADDKSTDPRIHEILKRSAAADRRITVTWRPQNGHICRATNSALELATGTYIGLLDNDDLLTPHALFEMAKVMVADPLVDYLYSDEDKIDDAGTRFEPYYKPGWSPDLLCGFMYTCHLSVYRTSLIRDLGGFRPGFEGSQDHDLCFRATERTSRIRHIDDVLYHWRVHSGSTAASASVKSYASDTGLRAVQDHLDRRGEGGRASPVPGHAGRYYTRYPARGTPLISIIIPTRDGADVLSTCLDSVFGKTAWEHFEIIVIDNGSVLPETFALFSHWRERQPARFRVERHDIPFNFSRINNLGAAAARGDILLLLNNDTEVIAPTWLEEMLSWTQRPSIGVVGAMLLYPDNTIQHAGVILGIGGVAGHSHKYLPAGTSGHFGRLLIPATYSAVTAACLMVRKQVFYQVGGLDEELQVAFNDIDFCCKVAALGLRGVVPPEVKLYHFESKSRGAEDTPAKQARFIKEVTYMQDKWNVVLQRDPQYNPNLSRTHEDFRLAGTEPT